MRLEPVAPEDVERLLAGDTDDRELAPGWPHQDTAAGLAFLRNDGSVWLVLDDAGRVAGEVGIKAPPDPDGMVEIGYGLAAPSRGHGLGSAAATALVELLRDDPRVRVVEAEVHHDNLASRRILERLGMRLLGPADAGYLRFRLLLHDD